MTTVQVISGSLEDRLRRELVYAGDLLVFKGVGQMSDLCDLTDELVCEALDASEPVGATGIERENYVARVGALQRRYRKHHLKNTNASWDLEEIRTGKNVPVVLEPAEPVGTASELRA